MSKKKQKINKQQQQKFGVAQSRKALTHVIN